MIHYATIEVGDETFTIDCVKRLVLPHSKGTPLTGDNLYSRPQEVHDHAKRIAEAIWGIEP